MIHGLLICLLVILFYHQEMESFLSKSGVNYEKYIPKPSKKETIAHFENNLEKDYTSVDEAYPLKIPTVKKANEAIFRKERCVNSRVQYKNQHLKNHLVTHVYPELDFVGGECNPCDPTCRFIVHSKQSIEDKLKPLNTRTTLTQDIMTFIGFPEKEPFGINDSSFTLYQ